MSSSSESPFPERSTGAREPVPSAPARTACGGTLVAPLLSRLGAELEAQARAVETLHEAVAAPGTAGRAGAGAAAQSVDLVSRHLHALAAFLEAVAALPAVRLSPIAVPGALVAAVPLSALAGRLRGETPAGDEPGAFDLF